MTTASRIGIPGTNQFLDSTTVDSGLGNAEREAVFIADPTTAAARAAVTSTTPATNAYGLVTRNVDMSFDSFNRLRVSNPHAQLSGFNEYKINPFNFVTRVVGAGTVTHSTTTKLVTLSTGSTTSGDTGVLQSRAYLRYNPGNSLLIKQTFVMGAVPGTNAAKRVGYFDDSNGIFLNYAATGLSLVRRSNTSGSVVDTPVAQADWDVDPLNGTGPSGITLDMTMGQIFVIDLQFLGVGTVRCGFEVDGNLYWCHFFHHSNRTAVQPYIATANLPVRWQVINTGTAASTTTMYAVCASVMEEGSEEPRSIQYAASNGATGIATSTTLKPILSIRPGPTFNGITNRGWIIPQSAELFCTGTAEHYYQVIWNATLTGPSWTAVNTNAMGQYDVTASAVSLGSGVVVEDGYIGAGGSTKSGSAFSEVFGSRPLVNSYDGTTPDTLTMAVRTISGTGTGYGAFSWRGFW
jgi:hypothetical protein